jgi:hypothetical protein
LIKNYFSATFKASGQNVGHYWTGGTYTVEQVIDTATTNWWNENAFATMDHIKNLTTIE